MAWKIIDVGAFRSSALRDFLAFNPDNRAVLTDHADFEMSKGPGLENVHRFLEIAHFHREQLVLLKGTGTIIQLVPVGSDPRARLADWEKTRGFRSFVSAVARPNPNAKIRDGLNEHVATATSQIADVREAAAQWVPVVVDLMRSFEPALCKALRTQAPLNSDDVGRIIHDILYLAALHLREHGGVTTPPSSSEVRDSYAFRFALSTYFLAIDWISKGGIETVRPDRLANDLLDMTYVAYATLFDGLLSHDQKLLTRYAEVTWCLDHCFPTE